MKLRNDKHSGSVRPEVTGRDVGGSRQSHWPLSASGLRGAVLGVHFVLFSTDVCVTNIPFVFYVYGTQFEAAFSCNPHVLRGSTENINT